MLGNSFLPEVAGALTLAVFDDPFLEDTAAAAPAPGGL